MHSVNKVNFAIMYWFEMGFAPRFTSLQAQLKHLYCGDDIAQYENLLIKPVKKHLIGKTDLDVAISNECGRLLANVVTAFNSTLLSQLLERYQREGNQKALDALKKISPVAWQHIHFLGHYAFRNENPIDLAAMLAGLDIV